MDEVAQQECSNNKYYALTIRYISIYIYVCVCVGSQIVAHTLIEAGNGPNKPNTINL